MRIVDINVQSSSGLALLPDEKSLSFINPDNKRKTDKTISNPRISQLIEIFGEILYLIMHRIQKEFTQW